MNLPCHLPPGLSLAAPIEEKSRLQPGLTVNHTISSPPARFQQPSSYRPPLQVAFPFNTSHLACPCSLQLPY